jgi:hypothetical protein
VYLTTSTTKMAPQLNLNRITLIAIFIWLIILCYIASVMFDVVPNSKSTKQQNEVQVDSEQRIDSPSEQQTLLEAKDEIDRLRRENDLLNRLVHEKTAKANAQTRTIANDSNAKKLVSSYKLNELPFYIYYSMSSGPSMSVGHISPIHEELRRKIENNIAEIWYAMTNELKTLQKRMTDSTKTLPEIDKSQKLLTQQYRSLLADAIKLSNADAAQEYRKTELNKLHKLVQSRFDHLQNPQNCNEVKRLVCNLNKGCGFGCQLHHAVYCMVVAYASERHLHLETDNWRYAKQPGGWTNVFQPTSKTCSNELTPNDRVR